MVKILMGTCSWTDKTLIECGRFYPPWVKKPEERLRFYSSIFPTVEVDSSYYSLPSRRNSELWTERTPSGFKFHVKAFRLFTGHWATVDALPGDLRDEAAATANSEGKVYLETLSAEIQDTLWRSFEDALLPLDSAGKLGVVLFQFPSWFPPSRRVLDSILECKARLPQYQLAIEFRNNRWFMPENTEKTLSFLRDYKLVYVVVDEPQGFQSSIPPIAEATDGIAYVRFHGRNRAMWEAKGAAASERFDYWYRDEELNEWTPRLQYLAEHARETHVLVNTNRWDQGPQNARRLAKVLHAAGMKDMLENLDAVLGLPEYASYP